jgi:hypothetical protein
MAILRRSFMRFRFVAVIVAMSLVGALAQHARGGEEQFKAPENGVITDRQFDKYLAATRDWLATSQAAGKAMEDAKSGAGRIAVLASMGIRS